MGTIASKGHCINFANDIANFAEQLPRLARDLSLIIIRKRGTDSRVTNLRVRRECVQKWLVRLKRNFAVYRNLRISDENLNQLPDDGFKCDRTDHNWDWGRAQLSNLVTDLPVSPHSPFCIYSRLVTEILLAKVNCACQKSRWHSISSTWCNSATSRMVSVRFLSRTIPALSCGPTTPSIVMKWTAKALSTLKRR